MISKNQSIEELQICAILQGFGEEDDNLCYLIYNRPCINAILYSKLLKIRTEDIERDESLSRALVSEEVLAKDWDTPEEDEAWKDL